MPCALAETHSTRMDAASNVQRVRHEHMGVICPQPFLLEGFLTNRALVLDQQQPAEPFI